MTYTRLMGACITNEEEYSTYRKGMLPILQSYGGSFGYDFKVSQVLIAKTDEPINRVFTIEFPSQEVMEKFFSDPNYLVVKKAHLDISISSRTVIGMFESC
ncbi:MAG: DUF1330 domain-containing protein [Cellvibrio sp.]|nr:DUF1330 domain-containing protein [Cellvibrio sp.]